MTDSDVTVNGVIETITTSMLARVRKGDPTSWKELYRIYSPVVLLWCKRGGLKRDEALDVCQEVMLAVHRSISSMRRDRPGDSFRRWLKTITHNKIIDHFRRDKLPSVPMGAGFDPAFPERGGDYDLQTQDDNRLILRQIIELVRPKVSEANWTAFEKAVVEGKPAAEVAAELCISTNQVFLAKSRILKRLRLQFERIGDEPQSTDGGPPAA